MQSDGEAALMTPRWRIWQNRQGENMNAFQQRQGGTSRAVGCNYFFAIAS